MLTADTITDEQIAELRASLPKDPPYGSIDYYRALECSWAVTPLDALGAFERDRKKVARARCAEILNARKAAR